MPVGVTRVERTRVLPASPQDLWAIIGDPHHQPRWWPGVERMEAVEPERFTQVLRTRRGRPVRVDYEIVDGRAPALVVWRQELEGSPFARVLSVSEIRIVLEGTRSATRATRVTITQMQRLRGSNRTGRWMLARATRRRLDEALAGLAAIVG